MEAFEQLKGAIADVMGVVNALKEGFGIFVENGATVKEEPEEVTPNPEPEDEYEDEFENVLALDGLDLDI